MSNKLTPLQELLDWYKLNHQGVMHLSPIIVLDKIKSLLEKETAFAKEAWDACNAFGDEQEQYPYGKRGGYTKPDFNQFISQYNQEK